MKQSDRQQQRSKAVHPPRVDAPFVYSASSKYSDVQVTTDLRGMGSVQTFMGNVVWQEFADLIIWEEFFNRNHVGTFIELGTGWGGMSLFFAMQCKSRGIGFYTYDNQMPQVTGNPLWQALGMDQAFNAMDIFTDKQVILDVIANAPHPIAVFMDNGDKPKEWQVFAPALSPGDFCIVHDWDTEFSAADIGSVKVERIMTDMADKRGRGWKAMWFKRT